MTDVSKSEQVERALLAAERVLESAIQVTSIHSFQRKEQQWALVLVKKALQVVRDYPR